MKIKSGFVVRKIMDEFIVVPVGQRVTDFNGLITLNESGKFLWDILVAKDSTIEGLTDAMLEEYEIDRTTAELDVQKFVLILRQQELIEA